MRTFLATVIGVLAGGIAIWLLEFLGHTMFPVKFDLAPGDIEAFKTFMLRLPVENLIAILIAHAIGLLIGLYIARKIDRDSTISLYIISSLLMLGTVLNLLAIPHPTWFAAVDIAIILIVSLVFIRSVSRT